MTQYTKHSDRGKPFQGPEHAAPIPMRRLAPPIGLVDAAREIEAADSLLGSHLEGKLRVIASQIRALRAEAERLLAKARQDRELHRARCRLPKRAGRVYHLYCDDQGPYFSMLSPEDWRGRPPHPFQGSYRLEADMSWTRVDRQDQEAGADPDGGRKTQEG